MGTIDDEMFMISNCAEDRIRGTYAGTFSRPATAVASSPSEQPTGGTGAAARGATESSRSTGIVLPPSLNRRRRLHSEELVRSRPPTWLGRPGLPPGLDPLRMPLPHWHQSKTPTSDREAITMTKHADRDRCVEGPAVPSRLAEAREQSPWCWLGWNGRRRWCGSSSHSESPISCSVLTSCGGTRRRAFRR